VVKQHWHWDGISGDSLIFNSSDVSEFNNQSLQDFITTHAKELSINTSGTITFKRNHKGYCFINFNFESF